MSAGEREFSGFADLLQDIQSGLIGVDWRSFAVPLLFDSSQFAMLRIRRFKSASNPTPLRDGIGCCAGTRTYVRLFVSG